MVEALISHTPRHARVPGLKDMASKFVFSMLYALCGLRQETFLLSLAQSPPSWLYKPVPFFLVNVIFKVFEPLSRSLCVHI